MLETLDIRLSKTLPGVCHGLGVRLQLCPLSEMSGFQHIHVASSHITTVTLSNDWRLR